MASRLWKPNNVLTLGKAVVAALAALRHLPAAARISVAQLQANDVIVIEVPGCLPQEQRAHIRDTALRAWPGRTVFVLEGGLMLKIVSDASHV